MKYILERTIRIYQILLSPWLGGQCRFHPTCSEYFLMVLRRHPLLRALFLGTKRLLKCHPYHPGGVDLP